MYGDRRRRFAKACDSCRSKKLRCDGVRPLCARCRAANTPCHYADVQKPATRRSRARDSAGTPQHLGDQNGTGPVTKTNSPSVQWSNPAGVEAPRKNSTLSDQNNDVEPTIPATGDAKSRSTWSRHQPQISRTDESAGDPGTIVGRSVDTRFFGPASGISLVSIRENRRESDTSKRHGTQHRFQEGSWSSWTHSSIQGMLEKRVCRPLPPWTEAFPLVSEFFSHEHQQFPCFHPPTFMTLLGQQYSGSPSRDPAWWASLNAVLAISQRRRVENGQCGTNGEGLVWDYAANALGTTLDIMMRNTQLKSVQALLCIAWFFLGTPNPQPSFMLTGSAVRLAHSIGLHKTDHANASLGSIEHETRNKVFWLALILDRKLCLQTGRPPTHDLEHFPVRVPTDCLHDDSEFITTMDGSKLRLTKSHAELCLIQDRIYNELYSSQSLNDTSCIVESVSRLTIQLRDWCATIPGLHAKTPISDSGHQGLIRLHYSYYNCVVLIHRPLARKYWLSAGRATASGLPEGINNSIQQCLIAARCIIDLLQAIPHKQKSFYWDVVPPILSATIILATNAMHTNLSDATKGDLGAISRVIELFEILDEEESDTYLFQVRRLSKELYQNVALAFKSSERQSSSQQRQQVWAVENDVNGNEESDNMQDTQGFQASTNPSGDILPIGPGDGASSSALLVEPDLGPYPFAANAWPPGILSFPDLTPWGMDILSGGLFTP